MKKEKLTLRLYLHHISYICRPLNGLFKHKARISLERRSVGMAHITDQPCCPPLSRTPGKYLKGIRVRIKIHIRFLKPHIALSSRTVKHTSVVQGIFHLSGCNGHRLHYSKQIRKLQADKLHILLPDDPEDILSAVFVHGLTTLSQGWQKPFPIPVKCIRAGI